jgi:hypothetical protein
MYTNIRISLSTSNTNFMLAVFRHLYNTSVEFPFIVLNIPVSFFPDDNLNSVMKCPDHKTWEITVYICKCPDQKTWEKTFYVYQYPDQKTWETTFYVYKYPDHKAREITMHEYCLLNVQWCVCCIAGYIYFEAMFWLAVFSRVPVQTHAPMCYDCRGLEQCNGELRFIDPSHAILKMQISFSVIQNTYTIFNHLKYIDGL